MLRIGEFSKIAQVSIKTLRYYDRLGLLKPAHIDRYNGYRYYNLSQLPRLNRILALKDLDFSLDQIQELLKLDLTSTSLQNMLRHKTDELRSRIVDEHARLLRVESRLMQFGEDFEKEAHPVILKTAPHYLVATVRKRLPALSYLADWQRETLLRIHQCLAQQSISFTGPDLLIYHHDEFREEDLDMEVGTIIREIATNTESGPVYGDIKHHTLPGVNHLASTLHTQPSQALGQTYAILTWWTQANGFQPIGPWRELTYEQESPNRERMIEVQRPVMKAIDFYSQLEKNTMEPKIISKPGFTLLGLRYYGKNEHGEISQLWGQFNRRMASFKVVQLTKPGMRRLGYVSPRMIHHKKAL